MANPTSNYAKKLKDGVINQVVNDSIMAKGSSGKASYKKYSKSVDALCKCNVLCKRVESEYNRRRCWMWLY